MAITRIAVLIMFMFIIFALSAFTTLASWNGKSILDVESASSLSMPKFSNLIYVFIFVGNLLNLIWQSVPEHHQKTSVSSKLWFTSACIFQALWALSLCHGYQLAASIFAVALFLSLAQSCNKTRASTSWVSFPLNIWFGWATVLIIREATAAFSQLGMTFFNTWYWTLAVVSTLTFVAIMWVALDTEAAFAIAISWGLFCIYWQTDLAVIRIASLVSYICVTFLIGVRLFKEAYGLIKKRRSDKPMPSMELPIYIPVENNQSEAHQIVLYPQEQAPVGQYFYYYPYVQQTIPVDYPTAPEYEP